MEHGKPLLFGADKNKGIRLNVKTLTLEAVTVGENGVTVEDILVHDETNRSLATLLAEMDGRELPVALGVIYCDPAPTYEEGIESKIMSLRGAEAPSLDGLLRQGHTWQA